MDDHKKARHLSSRVACGRPLITGVTSCLTNKAFAYDLNYAVHKKARRLFHLFRSADWGDQYSGFVVIKSDEG